MSRRDELAALGAKVGAAKGAEAVARLDMAAAFEAAWLEETEAANDDMDRARARYTDARRAVHLAERALGDATRAAVRAATTTNRETR